MRFSWNEIRARAAAFSEEWKDARYEKGETQSFYNEFFNVFGVQRKRVGIFEKHVKKLDNQTGFIDLFWPGVLLVEQKSAGRDLEKALEQAADYCTGLKPAEQPRWLMVSDFQNFVLYDLEERTELSFPLMNLHGNVEAFGFVMGVEKREFRDQDPVNVAASELMGEVHDSLAAAGYGGHDLERFLVRLVFCLFADDTGIFERGSFQDWLENRTLEDGTGLGGQLAELFQVLNTQESKRQEMLDEDLKAFPYINGDLFRERLDIPAFTAPMRRTLIKACLFDWGKVSPAIFGSLFQSVMDKVERRQQGAHYTPEKNILKVIEPLFMDELRKEFEKIKKLKGTRKKALQDFQGKLGGLTFFDPACGCGNFMVIAYRELRRLEIEVLREMHPKGQRELDVAALSRIDVDQFYGIEIGEFPCRIAETALWMMDHIMNNELSQAFGQFFARIPLKKSPHIRHADALEIDWDDLLPAKECSYVFGNPPFGGAKFQSNEQRAQVKRIADLGKSGGSLDYVTAWFLKAGDYVQRGRATIGFVATNSITNGEQTAQLWPLLFDRFKLEIAFAHRTFAWGSEARGKAHVHVVIIGLTRADMEPKQKRLFSYPDINGDPEESQHETLSPYLFDAGSLANRHLVVKEESRAINGLPKLVIGSKPIDDGHYIFTEEEKILFLEKEPDAEKFLRPFIGAKEYIQGGLRWILSLHNASPTELKALPEIRKRIAAVRKYRAASKSKPTQKISDTPTLYHVNVIPDDPFLVVPEVSSERREYVPIGWLEPPIIPSNRIKIIQNAELYIFGILTSKIHMAWLRHIGGRLESRYLYSIGVVYNPFPMPNITESQKTEIGKQAQAVLDARTAHPGETLATLYDPEIMPVNLRKAHTALDRAVDRLYRKAPFNSERERVEHLFALYEKMTAPLTAKPKGRKKRA